MAASVTSVYLHVVEDVINNVRHDFQSEGVDDNVLNELQALWELKMLQSGAIKGGSVHESPANPAPKPVSHTPAATPVHDLNVPYDASDDYETPTLPRAPALTSTGEPVMYQYMPPGPSEAVLLQDAGLHLDGKLGSGRPSAYMHQPAAWMNQKHRGVELNMNETYEEREDDDNGFTPLPTASQGPPPVTKDFLMMNTGKRKHGEIASGYFIPQRDGAADIELCTSADENCNNLGAEAVGSWATQRVGGRREDSHLQLQQRLEADAAIELIVHARDSLGSSAIPQLDGIDDNYDDAVAEEDYNEPGEDDAHPVHETAAKPAGKAEPTESEGSEPPLCEDDDDDDDLDENDQGDEEPSTNNLVLAQFDKVTRSKNKWKCTLKDGIMHLNNRDILFVKANGEFEF